MSDDISSQSYEIVWIFGWIGLIFKHYSRYNDLLCLVKLLRTNYQFDICFSYMY